MIASPLFVSVLYACPAIAGFWPLGCCQGVDSKFSAISVIWLMDTVQASDKHLSVRKDVLPAYSSDVWRGDECGTARCQTLEICSVKALLARVVSRISASASD